MVEKETVVGAEQGLHARPAALFVRRAKGFASEIKVIKGTREANAKSSLKLMSLAAKKGERVVISAEGPDEQAAVDALVELVSGNDA